MTQPNDSSQKITRLQGWVLSLVILCVGLTALVVILWMRVYQAEATADAKLSPDIREAAIARLVESAGNIWDSHPDPEVGRLLQPGLENRAFAKGTVSSNSLGLRERDFIMPKPDGVVRVVLLGDSFVFGVGVEAEDRFGRFLERTLQDNAGVETDVEVLHVGLGSWNILAETAYLRRNLSNFQPDLVIQVLVSNDIDDSGSVRGFGAVADFTSQRPRQTNTFYQTYPIWGLGRGFRKLSYINAGYGYESRRRYAEANRHLVKTHQLLEQARIDHLFVLSWQDRPETAASFLFETLPSEHLTYTSATFRADPRYRVSPSNPHWSREGHEQMARFLYGAMLERDLLASLHLADSFEARAVFREMHREGLAETQFEDPPPAFGSELVSRLSFPGLDEQQAAQIYGGIDAQGHVAPYAATLLATRGGQKLRLVGKTLDRPELAGVELTVFADEIRLGTVTLPRQGIMDLTYPLPAVIAERPAFDVRLVADDYAYLSPSLRDCIVLRLDVIEATR